MINREFRVWFHYFLTMRIKLIPKTKDKFIYPYGICYIHYDEQWRNIETKTKENIIFKSLSADSSLEIWSQLLIFPG